MVFIFDTNSILRFLMRDNNEQFLIVRDKLEEISRNGDTILVTGEVVMECVYVLEKIYKVSRADILSMLGGFLKTLEVNVENRGLIMTALENYSETRLAYVDCLISELARETEAELFTFDKKLAKFSV